MHIQEQVFHPPLLHTKILVLTVPLALIFTVTHRFHYHSISSFQAQLAHFLRANWYQLLDQALHRVH